VPKINKKNSSSKSKCRRPRISQKLKECKNVLERYANWRFDSITREDIAISELLRSYKSLLSFNQQIELIELESEICRAMIVFCHIDSCEKILGILLAESESRSRFKKLLGKQIKRINLKAKRILAFLT